MQLNIIKFRSHVTRNKKKILITSKYYVFQRDENVAKKSQAYLEKNLYNLTSPAALAATVLALVLSRYDNYTIIFPLGLCTISLFYISTTDKQICL